MTLASLLRAGWTPVRLAAARAKAAPAAPLLVAAGVAIAVALLGTAAGAGALAGERAARDALARLPVQERALRISWSGGLAPGVPQRARATLRDLTPAPQTSSVLLLATRTDAGGPSESGPVVQLAAIAPLGRWIRLTSGRLPRSCTPRRCEVVQVGGPRADKTLTRGDSTVVVVGRGRLASSVPLGFVPRAGVPAGGDRARTPRVLVGGDPNALDALTGYDGVFRSHGWSAALDLGGRPSWQLGALRARMERTANALSGEDESFSLAAPTDALAASAARAAAARRRMALVGAGAAALLGAFAFLAAGLMRRDLEAERARLRRRGAHGVQLAALDAVEGLGPALAGVLTGGAVAIAVTLVRAHDAAVPAGTLVSYALLRPGALLAALACWVVAGGVVAIGARPWGPASGRVADALAIGAALALAVALARGGARAGDPGDPLPTLLVPMALLVAALVLARAAPAALRGIEVAARRGPLQLRMAALGVARGSGGPALTVAVVALACALACFAAAYRSTLQHGAADQAAFRVPMDVTVQESGAFVAPFAAAPPARWRALAGGGPVVPVIRRDGSLPGTQTGMTVLGVPAADLAGVRQWRPAGGASRDELAARLRSAASAPPAGVPVRDGDRDVSLRVRSAGDALDLTADLVGPDGSVEQVRVGRSAPTEATLRARLPAGARGRKLVALEATEPAGLAITNDHQRAERPDAGSISTSRLRLSGLTLGGRAVSMAGWCSSGPLRPPVTRGPTTIADVAFDTGGRALLRPCSPAEDAAVPVLADPTVARGAGRGGRLTLLVQGNAVRARVVGTLERFPTVGDGAPFVVADAQALGSALTTTAPGSAQPEELWIGASPAAEARLRAALRTPALSALDLSSRRAIEQRLRADPLARELSRTLAVAAIAALVLAAGAVLLVAVAALRDEGAELFELEAVGADPGLLRADVRLRAGLLAALGLLAGAVVGAVLLTLVVDAVQLTATGRAAFPPLIVVVPWPVWLGIAVVFGLVCAALVAAGTRRALSGPVPRTPPGVAP
jgi:hypothetical protein